MLRDRQQHLPRSLRRCNGGVYVYSWERQSGAVASRALGVWPDYLAHARVLDGSLTGGLACQARLLSRTACLASRVSGSSGDTARRRRMCMRS